MSTPPRRGPLRLCLVGDRRPLLRLGKPGQRTNDDLDQRAAAVDGQETLYVNSMFWALGKESAPRATPPWDPICHNEQALTGRSKAVGGPIAIASD